MIFSILGENNSGKSGLGLGFPPILHYFDFDPGGFKRGLGALKDGKARVESGQIVYHAYPMPVSTIKANLGVKLEGGGNDRLHGMKELWYGFVDDFCTALDDVNVFSLMVDTFSQLYPVAADAFLQEKQESQEVNGKLPSGKNYREQLIQIEYRDINQRMHAIFDAIPEHKNLIIVHHMDDVWGKEIDSKGKVVDAVVGRDAKGWKKCGRAGADLADIVMQMEQKQRKKAGEPVETYFEGTFTKAPPILMGQTVEMPTYQDIITRLQMVS